MEYELVTSMIKDVGFPIVVAIFVLFRLNGSLNKLKSSLDNLSGEMQDRDESLVRLVSKIDMMERTVYRLAKRQKKAFNDYPLKDNYRKRQAPKELTPNE